MDNDLGRGPTISHGHFNPCTVKPRGVASLRRLFQNGKLNQSSSIPMYHISLIIRKSVIVDSLAQDPKETPYPNIIWVNNLTDMIKKAKGLPLAVVADRNHHASLCETLHPNLLKGFIDACIILEETNTKTANNDIAHLACEKRHCYMSNAIGIVPSMIGVSHLLLIRKFNII